MRVFLTLEEARAAGNAGTNESAKDRQAPGGLTAALIGLPGGVAVAAWEGGVVTLRVPRPVVTPVASALLQRLPVVDLAVEDPPIERVIEAIYEAEEVPQ